jgi:hypothetical protein
MVGGCLSHGMSWGAIDWHRTSYLYGRHINSVNTAYIDNYLQLKGKLHFIIKNNIFRKI